MVLVVISLGFSNAFMNLAKPGSSVLHLVLFQCPATTEGMVSCNSRAMFSIYVLIGTRFLLTNWLYLRTTYREDNPKELWILPDAIGIFLTGVLIGVQSSYALTETTTDFFALFCLVLFVDVATSIASVITNWRAIRGEGLCQELCWFGNNLAFGILTLAILGTQFPVDSTGSAAKSLMGIALLNCTISFVISWFGYFRTKRTPPKHALAKRAAGIAARIHDENLRQWLVANMAGGRR